MNSIRRELGRVTGSAFEAVDESALMVSQDSDRPLFSRTNTS